MGVENLHEGIIKYGPGRVRFTDKEKDDLRKKGKSPEAEEDEASKHISAKWHKKEYQKIIKEQNKKSS